MAVWPPNLAHPSLPSLCVEISSKLNCAPARVGSHPQDKGSIDAHFVLFFHAGTNAAYVAMGLSDDAKMGEDLTTECVPENGRVNLYSSYTSASPYSAVRANVVSGTTLDYF